MWYHSINKIWKNFRAMQRFNFVEFEIVLSKNEWTPQWICVSFNRTLWCSYPWIEPFYVFCIEQKRAVYACMCVNVCVRVFVFNLVRHFNDTWSFKLTETMMSKQKTSESSDETPHISFYPILSQCQNISSTHSFLSHSLISVQLYQTIK